MIYQTYSSAGRFQTSTIKDNYSEPRPPSTTPTLDTDSAELNAVLLDQVTRGKPHTYPHQPQPLPVSPRTLLLAVHFPQSRKIQFQSVFALQSKPLFTFCFSLTQLTSFQPIQT
ncbi:hypothetical protein ATANTOWER_003407 [Ataeniobius toweri]|uniref:Uncharacterized protein n=1 Tax=Ataeniobius toweri TaxID=208326 RepID=A0ABU7BDK6_9TELE|nr:hypothetical protein [Ataeniobius toweri]